MCVYTCVRLVLEQFDLTSMCSTAKNLFGLKGFLTQRDAWAGSFHELLTLDKPRKDAPLHLPDAPEGGAGRRRELLGEQSRSGAGDGGGGARHCSANAANACALDREVTQKQRNQAKWLSSLTHTPVPAGFGEWGFDGAAEWLHARWLEYMAY